MRFKDAVMERSKFTVLLLLTLGMTLSMNSGAVYAGEGSISSRAEEFVKMPLPKDLFPIPQVKCPIYVMEFHVWYRSPFGHSDFPMPGYLHWEGEAEAESGLFGTDWMRQNHSIGRPLLGFYNSEDRDVIRWQIRCLKNAGIDGAFIQMFPDIATGLKFGGDHVFKRMLEVASEEGMSIACHDEVMFRHTSKEALKPDVMGRRLGQFIQKYGHYPSYLKIQGSPAVNFQFWTHFMSFDDLVRMMKSAEEIAGQKIFWIVSDEPSELCARSQIGGFVPMSNGYFNQPVTEYKNDLLNWKELKVHLDKFEKTKKQYPEKLLGLWLYPGMYNSGRYYPVSDETTWFPRRGGKTIVETVRQYLKSNPGFLLISSWNDWIENTAIEPGLSYDNYAGDPYLYCRILAAMKGKNFVPPALPPKESVDPLMWQALYGVDRTPPRIMDIRYLPLDPGLIATVADSGHAVKTVKAFYVGDAYFEIKNRTFMGHGLWGKEITPPMVSKTDLILEPNREVKVEIDPAVIAGTWNEIYLGVEYMDKGCKGWLVIRYPADPPVLDYRNMDDVKFPVTQEIQLGYAGENRKAQIRYLRGFDLKNEKPFITLQYSPQRDVVAKPLRISRLHIFRDQKNVIDGVEVGFGRPESQVKTYRFKIPSLKGEVPSAVYLVAEDIEGNRSRPYPVFGGDYPSAGIWLEEFPKNTEKE
jgi:hypothetical protein